ncbi:MAG TPA: MFS transporter [Granulicella sp.]
MPVADAEASQRSIFTHPPLMALAVAAFGIGTTEFIIMGILPNVAADLHISIPKAGTLVSGYALTVTLGAPFITLATARLERKLALLLLTLIFTLGNLCCAIAPTYGLLLAARILTALCHGSFFGIGAVVATSLVPPRQRAQAVALMFSGLTLANVLGVPAGTALGQAYGWRAAFWAIVPIGLAATASVFFLVPRQPPLTGKLLHEFRVLRNPQVLLVLAMSVLSAASLYTVFTYIAPTLESVTRISPHTVTIVLLLFGVGITIGNLAGGTLSDRYPHTFLRNALLIVLASDLLLLVTEPHLGLAIANILLWGGVHFAAGAPLQSRIVDHSVEAPNLASTLNQGAFNLGNALGAALGGAALTAGAAYRQLPWCSAALAATALLLVRFSEHAGEHGS